MFLTYVYARIPSKVLEFDSVYFTVLETDFEHDNVPEDFP